jgi:hypothetical protein
MKYSVFADGDLIGQSELDHLDRGMGVAYGRFLPASAYDRVQSVFLLFTEGKHDEYYKARDTLNLQIRTEESSVVPTSWIHIVDHSVELGLDSMELSAQVCDTKWWEGQEAE